MTGAAGPTPASTPAAAASAGLAGLALALRELRTRTGLSLAALAAKTAYSKSSWERYLNARALPPRPAVRELCRLAGEPEGRCLALWEIAESEWGGRAGVVKSDAGAPARTTADAPAPMRSPVPPSRSVPQAPQAPQTPAPAPAPPMVDTPSSHRSMALLAVLASLCAVVFGVVVVGLLLLPHQRRAPSVPSAGPATGPLCRGAGCEGKNPMLQRCAASPVTLVSRRLATGAWMELRYSTACGTSWARAWGTHVGDRIEMGAGEDGRPTRGAEVRDRVDADTYVYTAMTATGPGTVVRACYRPAGGGPRECAESRVA
jgi:hypothetical protein